MRPASRRAGPSIPVLRSNQHFSECVSGKTTLRTVQAYAEARAGALRRMRVRSQASRPATGSFVCARGTCATYGTVTLLQRESSIGRSEPPS
jgi:hypothetical protein